MNKRIKKKKAKQKEMLMWCDIMGRPLPPIAPDGLDFNGEGYRDSTAAQAIRNVINERRGKK